jgi:hypothetical protein
MVYMHSNEDYMYYNVTEIFLTCVIISEFFLFIPCYRDVKPKYLAIAFDAERLTFRNDLYPLYKQHRSKVREWYVCVCAFICCFSLLFDFVNLLISIFFFNLFNSMNPTLFLNYFMPLLPFSPFPLLSPIAFFRHRAIFVLSSPSPSPC